jgi:hypothetical protein
MSKNIILVLMYHRHELLDLIYSLYVYFYSFLTSTSLCETWVLFLARERAAVFTVPSGPESKIKVSEAMPP